jgi:hypothetical protein
VHFNSITGGIMKEPSSFTPPSEALEAARRITELHRSGAKVTQEELLMAVALLAFASSEISAPTFLGPCSCADGGKCKHNEQGPLCMQASAPSATVSETKARPYLQECLDDIDQAQAASSAIDTIAISRKVAEHLYGTTIEAGGRCHVCKEFRDLVDKACMHYQQAMEEEAYQAKARYAEQDIREAEELRLDGDRSET